MQKLLLLSRVCTEVICVESRFVQRFIISRGLYRSYLY